MVKVVVVVVEATAAVAVATAAVAVAAVVVIVPASCAVLPCRDCERAVLVLRAPTALRRLRWTRSWTWRRVLRSHSS